MAHILIIEDDQLLNDGLAYALNKDDYEVSSAYSYAEGVSVFDQKQSSISLILLDIHLPDGNGTQLCSSIREVSNVPIIFLTANDTEQDMILGFQTGCDDYMAKPFSIQLLKQRIQAVLRRVDKDADKHLCISGDLIIDYRQMTVAKSGQAVKLTSTEYKLLELLAQHQGQVLTRESIVGKLWDINGNFVEENALSVNIRRLRQKIEDDPKQPVFIKTVFGIGYTWGDGK
ncbi:MAG: response regulator transcription factor [Candidatus Pristimantibacillus sp.]